MTHHVVAETAELGALARTRSELDVTVGLDDARALRQADVVLLGPAGWERLRAWRVGGLRTGVVVYTDGPSPDDRARLEPVVLLRALTEAGLAEALERLAQGSPLGLVPLQPGVVDLDRGRLMRPGGAQTALSTLEVRLLGYLGARADRSISREELQRQVWDHRKSVPSRAVDMAISRLRKKLEADPSRPQVLVTARHEGYRLLRQPPPRPPLPPQPPTLVGRDQTLDTLERLLEQAGAVLVTGPLGIGKTSVAVGLGLLRTAGDAGALLYVDLAGVEGLEDGLAAIARCGLVGPPSAAGGPQAIDTLCGRLAEVTRVLVVDHAEGAPGLVRGLLNRAPTAGLEVVVASRVAAAGVPMASLGPLDPEVATALLQAMGLREGVTLPDEEAASLAERCGGEPLALALSAEAVRLQGWEGLAGRLADPTAALAVVGEPFDTAHRALAAAWQLLPVEARGVLTRLAALRSPCSLAEAEGLTGAPLGTPWRVLVTHGCLVTGPGGSHVPVLVAAHARAADPEGWRAALDAHVAWLHDALEPWLPARDGTTDIRDLPALLARGADVAQALDTACRRGLTAPLGRLLEAADLVALLTEDAAQRLERVERVLPVASGDALAEARVRYVRGTLLYNRDRAGARTDFLAAACLAEGCPELAGRARLMAANLTWLLDGPHAALEALAAVEGRGLSPALALRLQADALVIGDLVEASPDTAPRLVVLMEELALQEAWHDAVRIGLQALVRYQLTRTGGRLELARRLQGWSTAIPDPRLRGHILVHVAEIEGLDGDRAASEAAYDQAQALFERADPIRVWQVRRSRAVVSAELAEDAAWSRMDQYRAWGAYQGAVTVQADALLWLASIAVDRGELARAQACAQEAEALAVDAELDHYVAFARLWAVTAAFLRDPGAAQQAVLALAPTALSGVGLVQRQALRAAVGDPDAPEALGLLTAGPGPLMQVLRDVSAAPGRDPAMLAETAAGTRGPPSISVRVVARIAQVGDRP